jgi:hypothetical protein
MSSTDNHPSSPSSRSAGHENPSRFREIVFVFTKGIRLVESEKVTDPHKAKEDRYVVDYVLILIAGGDVVIKQPSMQDMVTLDQLGVSTTEQLHSKCVDLNVEYMGRLSNEITRFESIQKRFNHSEFVGNRLKLLASVQDYFIRWFVEQDLKIPDRVTKGSRGRKRIPEHERIKRLVTEAVAWNPDATLTDVFYTVADAEKKSFDSVKENWYRTAKGNKKLAK